MSEPVDALAAEKLTAAATLAATALQQDAAGVLVPKSAAAAAHRAVQRSVDEAGSRVARMGLAQKYADAFSVDCSLRSG